MRRPGPRNDASAERTVSIPIPSSSARAAAAAAFKMLCSPRTGASKPPSVPIGDHAAPDLREHARDLRVVDAGGHGALPGDAVGEIDKRLAQAVEAAVVLQVFAVDVRDRGVLRAQQ